MSQNFENAGANLSGTSYRNKDNDSKAALLSMHKGASRPSYAVAGTIWIDDAADPSWLVNLFDGLADILIGTFDTTTDIFTPAPMSSFIRGLADDPDAATARATLGVTLGFEFIATADASDDATIDFTGFDASKYDSYLFVLSNIVPATDGAGLDMRTSSDGGSNYDSGASDYLNNALRRDTADANDALNARGFASSRIALNSIDGAGSAAGEDGYSGKVMLHGPHLAKRTIATFEMSYQNIDGDFTTVVGSAVRNSSAVVNSARFQMPSGNIESGTITMYGLRNAA